MLPEKFVTQLQILLKLNLSGIAGYIRIIARFVDLQTELPIKCAGMYYMYKIYSRTELYLSLYSGASLTIMGPKAKEKFTRPLISVETFPSCISILRLGNWR